MRPSAFKSMQGKAFMLVFLALTLFSITSFAGRDSYEIYLNKKLIFQQYVGESSSPIMNLQLDNAKDNDQLVVFYKHCHFEGAGKGRSIVIKNEKNQVLKEWKFADANGKDLSMSIRVKEILDLKKKNPNASLNMYYSSSELSKSEMLASIKLQNKGLTSILSEEEYLPATAAVFGLIGLNAERKRPVLNS